MSLPSAVQDAVKALQTCTNEMEIRVMKSKTVPKRPYKNFTTYIDSIRKAMKTLQSMDIHHIEPQATIPGRIPAELQNEMMTLGYTPSPKIYEATVDRLVNGQLNHYFSWDWGCAVTPQGTFNQALDDLDALATQNDWSTVNNPPDDDSDDGEDNRPLLPQLFNVASTSATPPARVPSGAFSGMKFVNVARSAVSPPSQPKGSQSNFFPNGYPSQPRVRESRSILEGVALDRHNRLYATDSKIRKPDFLVDKKHTPLVIVEDKIDNARRAVQQLIDYMMEFREDVMNPGDPKPLGLCYVLSKSKGLRVAMLRETEGGEIVGIGSEDALPERLFESLNWHDPTSDAVHDMLLSVYNTSLTL